MHGFTITTLRRAIIAFALICAMVLLASVALTPPPAQALGACAGGGSPCIEFQSNYRLADGSTFTGGPAGTLVSIHAGGFNANEGQTLTLGIVQGDDVLGTNPSPTFCSQAHTNLGVSVPVSSGSFTTSFRWPRGTSVGDWSICAYDSTGAPAAGGNTDNAAFDCTSPNPPTVSVSPSVVLPGGSVTVTGHGWLPDENMITVQIEACSTCSPIASYGNAASTGSGGDFSVPLTIPANAALGSYLVWAGSSPIPVDTGTSGPHLTVASSLAPTPTATPKPASKPTSPNKPSSSGTATPQSTATRVASATQTAANATATPSDIVGASNTSSSRSPGWSGWLVLALIGAIVLLGGIGGGIYFVRRRHIA